MHLDESLRFSGRLGQLESVCATSLAFVGYTERARQYVRSLPGSGFLLCTFILKIFCFFTSTVLSTLVII